MNQMSRFAVAFSVLLLAGCAVGPNYKRPQVTVPNQWTVAPARGTSTKPPETDAWWSSFRDAELDSLIARAVARNLTLNLPLERVQKAPRASAIARPDSIPPVGATVSAT